MVVVCFVGRSDVFVQFRAVECGADCGDLLHDSFHPADVDYSIAVSSLDGMSSCIPSMCMLNRLAQNSLTQFTGYSSIKC